MEKKIYCLKDVFKELNSSNQMIQTLLKRAYDQHPNKTAIHFLGRDVSYAELYEDALKFANYLQSLGVERGERVAIVLPNCPQNIVAYLGVLLCDAVVVQVDPFTSEVDWQEVFAVSNAKIVITLDVFYPKLLNVYRETSVNQIIVTKIEDYIHFSQKIFYPVNQKFNIHTSIEVKHRGISHLFHEILKVSIASPIFQSTQSNDQLLAIQCEKNKARKIVKKTVSMKELVNLIEIAHRDATAKEQKDNVFLLLSPLYDLFEGIVRVLLAIYTFEKVVLLAKVERHQLLETMSKQKPTILLATSTQQKKYLQSKGVSCINNSSVREVIISPSLEATDGKLKEKEKDN